MRQGTNWTPRDELSILEFIESEGPISLGEIRSEFPHLKDHLVSLLESLRLARNLLKVPDTDAWIIRPLPLNERRP